MLRDSRTDSLTPHNVPAQKEYPLGLENRCAGEPAPGVQIPLPPLPDGKSPHPCRKSRASIESAAVTTQPLENAQNRPRRWVTRARLAHACLVTSSCLVVLGLSAGVASAKPCDSHTGAKRAKCVRQHTAWPTNPTLAEVRNRMSADEWDALRWICRHEQPGAGWNGCWWSAPYTAFVGGLGMAHSTYGIGAAVTSYPYPPKATAAQQMAVGVIVMRKFGPSAWDSWGSRG